MTALLKTLSSEESTPVYAHKPMHILVVDDSKAQRKIVGGHLKKWGFVISEAASGAQALDLCKSTDFDLVLSDWMMPEMDGLEFCEAFHALDRTGYGYFILLTSRGEKSDIAQGLDKGADDFLTKPVNPTELRARINAGQRIIEMERKLVEQRNKEAAARETIQTLYDEIEKDLIEAEKLQQSLVPERHKRFERGDVSLLLQSSHKVGGDLVGFFSFSKDRIGLYSIDVSGHGVSSALLTARLAGYLSSHSKTQNLAFERMDDGSYAHRDPAGLASLLNSRMLEEMDTELYFTMAFADVDLTSGKVKFVQAGHPHPVVFGPDTPFDYLGTGGAPIGLIPDIPFETYDYQLKAGDRLFLYSDGITECADPNDRLYEEANFSPFIEAHSHQHGPEFLNDLIWDMTGFAKGAKFNDDVSAILFEYKP